MKIDYFRKEKKGPCLLSHAHHTRDSSREICYSRDRARRPKRKGNKNFGAPPFLKKRKKKCRAKRNKVIAIFVSVQ